MTVNGVLLDTRLLAYLIWGVGTLVVYTIVLNKRRKAFLRFRDRRAKRDLEKGVALWVVSVAAFLAITAVLFGETGTGIRGLFSSIALGAFAAAGLIMASETPERADTAAEARERAR